jgi:uncharacterized phage protein (TIGR02218 family)
MALWYEAPLTTLAFCWRLARRDGIVLGLTSHDRDLNLGGLLYQATPGMNPSAIEKSARPGGASVSLSGALSSGAITAADLETGRWDGALLTLYAVNWQSPEDAPHVLMRGALGSVMLKGSAFEVELLGPDAALQAPLTETTSPECRATLGDKRCRVDLAGRSVIARVTGGDDIVISVDQTLEPGTYGQGRLRWLDGANAGLEAQVLANTSGGVTLAEPPATAPRISDRLMITQGCDRRFSTCTGRFANAANFRGEPHLPGNDLLLRYATG